MNFCIDACFLCRWKGDGAEQRENSQTWEGQSRFHCRSSCLTTLQLCSAPSQLSLHLSLRTSPTQRPNCSIQLLPSGFRSSICPFAARWSRSGEPHIKNNNSQGSECVETRQTLHCFFRFGNCSILPTKQLFLHSFISFSNSSTNTWLKHWQHTNYCTNVSFCLYFTVQKFVKHTYWLSCPEKIKTTLFS